MSLLEVCQADVRDSITLHVEMRTFAAGTSSGGGGPSYVQRKRKSYAREVSQAKQFGAEILCNNDIDDNGRIIDPETSFHPKEKKKPRKRKTKQKAGESSILAVGPTSSETSTFPAPSQHPIHDLNLTPVHGGFYSANHVHFQTVQRPFMQVTPIPRYPMSNLTAPRFSNAQVQQFPTPSFSINSRVFPLQFQNPIRAPLDHWHSGMSPHQYEIVLLPNNVKKCYGCGNNFAEKYRSPPFNLIVRHMDRRVVKKCEHTGMLIYSKDFSNTYYHLVRLHIARKNPVFAGLAFISQDLRNSLNDRQLEILDESDINIVVR